MRAKSYEVTVKMLSFLNLYFQPFSQNLGITFSLRTQLKVKILT